MVVMQQAGAASTSQARKLTRRSVEEVDPQDTGEVVQTQSPDGSASTADNDGLAAAVAAAMANHLPVAADGAVDGSQEAAVAADQTNTEGPGGDEAAGAAEAPDEDEGGVPDQAASSDKLSLRAPVLAGSVAQGRKAWRHAKDPVLAVPQAGSAESDQLTDADQTPDSSAAAAEPKSSNTGAPLATEPQLSVSAAAETVPGTAAAEPSLGATAGGAAGGSAEATLRRLRQQPNRVLDESQVESGISYVGHNARLRRFMRRLSQGEAIRLGASRSNDVSNGHMDVNAWKATPALPRSASCVGRFLHPSWHPPLLHSVVSTHSSHKPTGAAFITLNRRPNSAVGYSEWSIVWTSSNPCPKPPHD